MRRYAYGRRPAVHTRHTMRGALLMAAALDPLGPAPENCTDYLAARGSLGPQMYDNDQIGDCTGADTANRLILRTANASTAVVPTVAEVVSFYSAVSGYVIGNEATDNGADLTAVCAYLVSTGFLGHKAAGVANLDPKNITHLKWGVDLFGGVRLGLNLPGYAEDLFDAGKPWDLSSVGDQSIEGHDVAGVHYVGNTLYVDTWGRTIEMTMPAFLAWCDEIKVELYPDWIREQGLAPSGFDLSDLTSKLASLQA